MTRVRPIGLERRSTRKGFETVPTYVLLVKGDSGASSAAAESLRAQDPLSTTPVLTCSLGSGLIRATPQRPHRAVSHALVTKHWHMP